MEPWSDESTPETFLPHVAEQIAKLSTGKPRYIRSEPAVASTAGVERV
jgi:hypothetical protein